ncbi:thiamine pyrophosphate-binding protein [Microbacterium sp. P04]|uniref:thiamine pyrophosphate-binding protein n=1 Tax=Microbacterium sp. P04 TaxID=3366947 RepID=UPI0037454B97
MNVSEAIAAMLMADEIQSIFTLPGSSCLSLLDSIRARGARIVLTGNEPSAVHAAHAYSATRSAGYGCAVLSRGPGAINGAVGIATASDGFPVLVIAGDNETRWRGRDVVNQDLPLGRVLAGLCDVFDISSPDESIECLQAARRVLFEQRRSCVLIVPSDVATAEIPVGAAPAPSSALEPRAAARRVRPGILKSAKRPFVIWGRSVAECEEATRAAARFIASRPDIPTAVTMRGLSNIPSGTWGLVGAMGEPELNNELLQSDLLVVVGENLRAESTGSLDEFHAGRFVLSIGPSAERQRYVQAGAEVECDVDSLPHWIDRLHEELPVRESTVGPPLMPLTETEDLVRLVIDEVQPSVVTLDSGQNFFVAARALSRARGRRVVYSDTQGTMGFAVPAALGAGIALNASTLAVVGDGGLLMTLSELPAIADAALPILLLVLDNSSLGMVRATQLARSMHPVATSLPSLRWSNIAATFGFSYHEIANTCDTRSVPIGRPAIVRIAVPDSLRLMSRGSVRLPLPVEAWDKHAHSQPL